MIFSENLLALVIFGLVKLVGYRYLAAWAGRYYSSQKLPAPILVALFRVALGAMVGGLVTWAFDVDASGAWYALLVLLRFFEWAVVFWACFERLAGDFQWRRLALFSFLGATLSCVLDLPAALGAAIPIFANLC